MSLIGVNVLVFLIEINMDALALERFFHAWGIVPLRFTHARLQSGNYHPPVVDVPAWWLDAHYRQHVVAVDFRG